MNMHSCKSLGLAALALALAAPAHAQAAAPDAAEAADATFAAWDADHNGVLSLEEFRKGSSIMAQAARAAARDAAEASLRGQFESIDANDDAAIGADEYPNLMLVRRAGTSAPPLADFDGNRDGRLQFAEYLALVRQLAKRR